MASSMNWYRASEAWVRSGGLLEFHPRQDFGARRPENRGSSQASASKPSWRVGESELERPTDFIALAANHRCLSRASTAEAQAPRDSVRFTTSNNNIPSPACL